MKMIFSYFLLSGLLLFTSCKKDYVSLTEDTSNSNSSSQWQAIKKAEKSMAEIMALNDYENLDWKNATVKLQGNNQEETLVTVVCKSDNERVLLYLISENTETYMWNNEVHSIDVYLNQDGSFKKMIQNENNLK